MAGGSSPTGKPPRTGQAATSLGEDRSDTIVAVVPAKDRAGTIGATVAALHDLGRLDRILVVDDGSVDATVARARAAGAEVLRLPTNRGKGAAVAAGVAACPEADVFLLIDADVARTAGAADVLLDPVLNGQADLVVGVLPAAGSRGGFGTVKRMAATGIHRACGRSFTAPLSGQRAVRAGYLRNLRSAERFGLEVAMTIDAARAGARVCEVPIPMDHRHTGRSLSGFVHRGRQGADIARALWSRITSTKARIRAVVLATVAVLAGLGLAGTGQVAASEAGGGDAEQVVLVGVPRLALDDLDTGRLPTIERLVDEGAMAATNVRTGSSRPSTAEAYATLGAGSRVRAAPGTDIVGPLDGAAPGIDVADILSYPGDTIPAGELMAPSMPAAGGQVEPRLPPGPGALGDTLAEHGVDTAVVNNSDITGDAGEPVIQRPAAVAVADARGSIGTGAVDADRLLLDDPGAPFGVRADLDSYLHETLTAMDRADMVVVDLGDTKRAAAHRLVAPPDAVEDARQRALEDVDRYLARLVPQLDPDTLLLVVGMRPPTTEWELTPTIAHGSGVVPGTLHSPSTRRADLITLTDLAPTILDWFDAEPAPAGMDGSSLRFRPEDPDLDDLRQLNDLAVSRERAYLPMALIFVAVQAVGYLHAAVLLRRGASARVGACLRLAVLTFAAWPLATFVERAIPGIEDAGPARQVIVWALAAGAALLASRARRRPLYPLAWIAGATVLVLVVDVALGANLQLASILGYSPHTASRYVGFGNTAFAVLAACAVVLAAIHVEYAPRRPEAVVTAGALLTIVLFAIVWPMLGADVGGILTLVPVFGLMLLALADRRVSWREASLFAPAALAVLSLVAWVDLLRADDATGHLGRLLGGAAVGDGDLLGVMARRWSTNVDELSQSIWAWMVPLAVAFMLYMLVIGRGWQRLLPTGSALRIGVVAAVAAGLVGWLVNDSGVVVSALVFVFLGPYLTLLALDHAHGQPELLPPTGPVVRGDQQLC